MYTTTMTNDNSSVYGDVLYYSIKYKLQWVLITGYCALCTDVNFWNIISVHYLYIGTYTENDPPLKIIQGWDASKQIRSVDIRYSN